MSGGGWSSRASGWSGGSNWSGNGSGNGNWSESGGGGGWQQWSRGGGGGSSGGGGGGSSGGGGGDRRSRDRTGSGGGRRGSRSAQPWDKDLSQQERESLLNPEEDDAPKRLRIGEEDYDYVYTRRVQPARPQ